MKDKHTRSIIKTFSWRIIATFTTMFLVFIFTGRWTLTLSVGIFDIILKLFFIIGMKEFGTWWLGAKNNFYKCFRRET